jgi:hypothetical protein
MEIFLIGLIIVALLVAALFFTLNYSDIELGNEDVSAVVIVIIVAIPLVISLIEVTA